MFSILFAVIRISFSKSALDISRLVSLRASTRWCDAQHHPHEQAGSLLHKAASITFSAMGCGDRLPALRWLWGPASSLAMVVGRASSSAMVVGRASSLAMVVGRASSSAMVVGRASSSAMVVGAGFQPGDGCGGGLPACPSDTSRSEARHYEVRQPSSHSMPTKRFAMPLRTLRPCGSTAMPPR